jgi:hypothetical protein
LYKLKSLVSTIFVDPRRKKRRSSEVFISFSPGTADKIRPGRVSVGWNGISKDISFCINMFVGGLERDGLEEISVITNLSVVDENSSYERGI